MSNEQWSAQQDYGQVLVPGTLPQFQQGVQPVQHYPQGLAPQLSTGHYGAGSVMVTDQRNFGGGTVAVAWVLAVLSAGYMLPWAIGITRGRSNSGAIGLLNLLLGWSFIGWVASLVMACQAHGMAMQAAPVNVMVHQQFAPSPYAVPPAAVLPDPLHAEAAQVPAGWYPSATGGQEYWDGQSWTGHTAP